MPLVRVNNVDIAYDWHGPEEGSVVVLIMGLGLPSTAWPPSLINGLAEAGFRVLSFDNRDSGQSTVLDAQRVPNIFLQALRYRLRLPVRSPYQLTDMSADVAALLLELAVPSAHIVGVSMGGMIAQCLAIERPDRVQSLTSIMSTTGERQLPGPSAAINWLLLTSPRSAARDVRVKQFRKLWELLRSPAHAQEAEDFDPLVARIFARGMPPEGPIRQLLAIAAAGNRAEALKRVQVPTQVIHGDNDAMLPLACGQRTADLVPDAKLQVVAGMGHDLPKSLVSRLVSMIVDHARQTEAAPKPQI